MLFLTTGPLLQAIELLAYPRASVLSQIAIPPLAVMTVVGFLNT